MKRHADDPTGLGAWKGQAFLSIGRALYLGPAGDNSPHAHHAVQVCVSLAAPFRLWHETGPWHEYDGVVVSPDVRHQLEGGAGDLVLFYVEPEGRHGRRHSRARSNRVWRLPRTMVESVRETARRITSRRPDPESLSNAFEELMASAGFARESARRLDRRVEESIARLREFPRDRPTMLDLARHAGLSPSRFRHLFRRDVGMSAQSYVVWLRIHDACAAIARGLSLSEAAHHAGFSDASHFTRTFRKTFGLAPSQIADRLTLM